MPLLIRPLGADIWGACAARTERHGGVGGGCWYMAFHEKTPGWGVSVDLLRAEKQALVAEGRVHAALVFDGKGTGPDQAPQGLWGRTGAGSADHRVSLWTRWSEGRRWQRRRFWARWP